MDIYLSKLIPLFLYPLGLTLVLLIAVTALLPKWTRLSRMLAGTSAVLLWAASTPIASDHLCASLEWRHMPIPVQLTPAADAIVVLGGAMTGPAPPRLTENLTDGADRLLHTLRLYRAGKARLILLSGGYIPWAGGATPEAATMRALLKEWGVPYNAIIMETDSRNTYENAAFTKQIMARHRFKHILLVTSALHMPRALATFRSAGIEATPAATDFTVTYRDHASLLDFLPSAASLSRSTDAIKEYIGHAYYRRKGWISG
jgi:uncharacterized SAM-binding protein YcdF (DUF218 family)